MIHHRFKFSLAHLAAGILFASIPLYILQQLWYPVAWQPFISPWPIFWIGQAGTILGPLLAALVFKPQHRRAMYFDMLVLLLLQCAIWGLALHGLYQGRPAWIVFVKDDWRILSPVEMQPGYRPPSDWFAGPKWIGALYAAEPEKRAQQVTRELMEGIPIESDASTHVPAIVVRETVAAAARPLNLLARNNNPEAITQALQAVPDAAGWLPLKGVANDGVVLVNAAGIPLQPVALAPWN